MWNNLGAFGLAAAHEHTAGNVDNSPGLWPTPHGPIRMLTAARHASSLKAFLPLKHFLATLSMFMLKFESIFGIWLGGMFIDLLTYSNLSACMCLDALICACSSNIVYTCIYNTLFATLWFYMILSIRHMFGDPSEGRSSKFAFMGHWRY